MIIRQSRYAAELSPDAAERFIHQQLQVQRDVMRRRGIAEDLIAQELRCMAGALQMEFLQATMQGSGDR
jgi:hypothetical protein